MKYWKTSEINYLRQNLHLSDKQLADKLQVTVSMVKGARRRNGIIRPKGAGQFKKGQLPWNTGIYYQPGGNSVNTRFKKGHRSHNTKHDGCISTRVDSKTGIPYLYIRLKKNKWTLLQRHIWEQNYGAIPKGHIVIFIDGDTTNVCISNLRCISRSENLKRNANRKKAAASMKQKWDIAKTYADYGVVKNGFGRIIMQRKKQSQPAKPIS